MENTDEKLENTAPDTDVDNAVAQIDEVAETGQTEEQPVTEEIPEDDSPIDVLKRYPKVCKRIAELMRERAENMALELLSKGMGYDEAVANADKEGYLRGKNEKIELVKGHRMPQLDAPLKADPAPNEMLFPRYEKHSIWEK